MYEPWLSINDPFAVSGAGYDHSVIYQSDLKDVRLRHNSVSYQKYNADTALCVMTKQQTVSKSTFIKKKDTIQNFQFWRVRFFTYSLNSCMWSKRCRLMGTPVTGSCSWHVLSFGGDEKKKTVES